MKVQDTVTKRKESRNGNRRYTLRDMAMIKLDQSILNSVAKREGKVREPNQKISVCGCGMEGCFIHSARTGFAIFDTKRRRA